MYKFKKGSEMIMIDSIVGRYKESYVAFLDLLGFIKFTSFKKNLRGHEQIVISLFC